MPPVVEIERESFVEIRDRRTRELITVIELLSPANKKPGPDREQYLAKRRQVLASPVHFVEIDLLRGGVRMPLEDFIECDYYAMVSRAEERPRAGVWAVSLADRLPEIPVPLRQFPTAPFVESRRRLGAAIRAGVISVSTRVHSQPLRDVRSSALVRCEV